MSTPLLVQHGLQGETARTSAARLRERYEILVRALDEFLESPKQYDPEFQDAPETRTLLSVLQEGPNVDALRDAFCLRLELLSQPPETRTYSARTAADAASLFRRFGESAALAILQDAEVETGTAVLRTWVDLGAPEGPVLEALLTHRNVSVRQGVLKLAYRLREEEHGRRILRERILPFLYQRDRAPRIRHRALECAARHFPETARQLLTDRGSLERDLSLAETAFSAHADLMKIVVLFAPRLESAYIDRLIAAYGSRSDQFRAPVLWPLLHRRQEWLDENQRVQLQRILAGTYPPQPHVLDLRFAL